MHVQYYQLALQAQAYMHMHYYQQALQAQAYYSGFPEFTGEVKSISSKDGNGFMYIYNYLLSKYHII